MEQESQTQLEYEDMRHEDMRISRHEDMRWRISGHAMPFSLEVAIAIGYFHAVLPPYFYYY